MRRGPELGRTRSREEMSRDAFQDYVEADTPDRPWQEVMKKQIDPVKVGVLSGIGFAALMVFDVVHNGPSSLVVNNPEAAATALAGGAAAIGALATKLVQEENAEEIARVRRAEREARKEKEEW